MTKLELITKVGQRLGDTSTNFLALLRPIFEDTLNELASNDCLRSLWRTNTFSITENTRDYNTNDISGLDADLYPLAIKSILVPAWGPSAGRLERKSREEFDLWRMRHTDADGVPVPGKPRIWRTYPNEFTLQLDPVASADWLTEDAELLYLAPPAVLADGDTITELRPEHIPAIIAGMVVHGLVFDQETVVDRPQALVEWGQYQRRLKRQNRWEAGRAIRTVYRDF